MKTVRLKGSDYTRYMKDTDGHRHTTQKSLFDAYGPVRIAGPNGRFLKVIRSDPGEPPASAPVEDNSVSVEQAEAQNESMRRMKNSGNVQRAPSPKSCKCRTWPVTENESIPTDANGKPTEHRRTCAFKKMWERQTGMKIKAVAAGPTLEPRIHRQSAPKNLAQSKPQLVGKPSGAAKLKEKLKKIPSPDHCPECGTWTKPKIERDNGLHHTACKHYKAHKQLQAAQQAQGVTPAPVVEKPQGKVVLFDLEASIAVRAAEADEVQSASASLRDSGAALVEVDGKSYLCMYEDGSSIEPAAEEKHDTEQPPSEDEPEGEEGEASGEGQEQGDPAP